MAARARRSCAIPALLALLSVSAPTALAANGGGSGRGAGQGSGQGPTLSGYGGPGSGAQVILGSGLVGGGGAGGGPSGGSGGASGGGIALPASSAVAASHGGPSMPVTSAGAPGRAGASHARAGVAAGAAAAASGTAAAASGKFTGGHSGGPSSRYARGGQLEPASAVTVAAAPLGLSSIDLVVIALVACLLAVVAVLTRRLAGSLG